MRNREVKMKPLADAVLENQQIEEEKIHLYYIMIKNVVKRRKREKLIKRRTK